ncbi:MAG: TIGR03862 family flavoprotein [Thermodesulfobacteriota bacterium]
MARRSAQAVVVGGGPAGLMAAEVLAAAGAQVEIYDAMPRPGTKFLLAGRGGLNLSRQEPLTRFVQAYGSRAAWLQPLFTRFGPAELRQWLAARGVATFVGTSGRIFPLQTTAAEILAGWLQRLAGLGVTVRAGHRWLGLTDDRALLFRTSAGEELTLEAGAVLLALGGASWPATGSDGAWAAILASRGCTVHPFLPSNCGFEAPWSSHFRERCAGQPLKNVRLTAPDGQTARGDLVITGYGLEGGAIYPLSRPLREAIAGCGQAELLVDLKPDHTLAQVAERLGRQPARASLAAILRKGLRLGGPVLPLLKEVAPPAVLADRRQLATLVKALPVTLTTPRPLAEAISTAGGLDLAELDEHLMIRCLPGIFAAGEMLDFEAPTGGYLLQAAFATGFCAGHGMRRWLSAHRAPAP